MVWACSGPITTAQCPDETALLLATVLIAEQMLSRMPSGSSATWFVTLCGGSAAITNTVESSGEKPFSTGKGAHGLSAPFSATAEVDFPGGPKVDLSRSPGTPPPTLSSTSLIARPI